MSLFKRLSATVYARVDESVRQIENHDAVVTASLTQTKEKIAQAKVQLNRVCADGEKLDNKINTLKKKECKWALRARENSNQNEDVALSCLVRRRECLGQINALEESLSRHQHVKQRLNSDITQLEKRLSTMTEQRNLLRTRQSTAEVNRCLQEIDGQGHLDVDDSFERWEQKIMVDELGIETAPTDDDFEQQFIDNEERIELKAELNALCKEQEVLDEQV